MGINLNYEETIIRLGKLKEKSTRQEVRKVADEIAKTGHIDERAAQITEDALKKAEAEE